MHAFLNGRILPEAEAVVPISDRGLLYGDGLFETLRVRQGRPLWWDRHWRRLRDGAEFLRIPVPLASEECRAAAAELMRVNQCPEAVLRVLLTRGSGPRGYSPASASRPTFAMSLHPCGPPPAGLRLVTATVRVLETDPLTRFKTANRLLAVLARAEAEQGGGEEALLLNTQGRVVEAGSGNLFWFEADQLCTTPLSSGALPGVIRGVLLEPGHARGWPVVEKPIGHEEFCRAQGSFVTNSVVGMVPVVSVDGRPVKPSARFGELQAILAEREAADR